MMMNPWLAEWNLSASAWRVGLEARVVQSVRAFASNACMYKAHKEVKWCVYSFHFCLYPLYRHEVHRPTQIHTNTMIHMCTYTEAHECHHIYINPYSQTVCTLNDTNKHWKTKQNTDTSWVRRTTSCVGQNPRRISILTEICRLQYDSWSTLSIASLRCKFKTWIDSVQYIPRINKS